MRKHIITLLTVACSFCVMFAAEQNPVANAGLPRMLRRTASVAAQEGDASVHKTANEVFSGSCGTNLTWSFNTSTGVLTIIGSGAMTNYTSSNRAPWYSGGWYITSVSLPDYLTTIGDYAFADLYDLTDITIPSSVTSIGKYAFYYSGLRSLTIPNSVTSIGNSALYGIPNVIYSGTATGSPWGAKSINGYVEDIWVYADATKTTLLACLPTATGDITVPNTVTTIGDEAFYYRGISTITVPNSVTSIGEYAFFLVSNVIYSGTATGSPWGARSVNGYVEDMLIYADATKNTLLACLPTATGAITIPNTLTTISHDAFTDCTKLTSITIPNSVTNIGSYAFYNCNGLTSITIPEGVTTIGDYAFQYCTGLTSVSIPSTMSSIGKLAFEYCNALTRVDISDLAAWCGISFAADDELWSDFFGSESNPLYKAKHLFLNGVEAENIVIPNTVTSIGDFAFNCCKSLRSVVFPNSVLTIGKHAFNGCDSLRSVVIPSSVKTISANAFYLSNNLSEVHISDITSWCSISFGEYGNPLMGGGHLYLNDDEVTHLIIPDSVTNISDNAFYNCHGLTQLTLGKDLQNIGTNSFSRCTDLSEIICNATSVPDIQANTFNQVSRETKVWVSAEKVDEYKEHIYWGEFDIEPQGAISVVTDTLHIISATNSAEIIWPTVNGANLYELNITKGDEDICTLIFDAMGQLTSTVSNAPARNKSPQQNTEQITGLSFTVFGLESNTQYAYSIIAKDDTDTPIETYTGTFTTLSDTPTDIENSAVHESYCSTVRKVIIHDNIYIIRDDMMFNVQGTRVK